MAKQQVQVGAAQEWEVVEFEGREADTWEGTHDSIDPHDPDFQFGVTLRLYTCPEGYRVHEVLWRVTPERVMSKALYPVVGHWGYGIYTEEEAREKWGDKSLRQ